MNSVQPRDPGPGTRTNTIGDPVERMLNASAGDILDALENGFRARADLKGKLAELFMSRHLDELQRSGWLDRYEWFDQDGVPDFTLYLTDSRVLTLEVKNVRSGPGAPRVESQKTRASRGDPMSRFYRSASSTSSRRASTTGPVAGTTCSPGPATFCGMAPTRAIWRPCRPSRSLSQRRGPLS